LVSIPGAPSPKQEQNKQQEKYKHPIRREGLFLGNDRHGRQHRSLKDRGLRRPLFHRRRLRDHCPFCGPGHSFRHADRSPLLVVEVVFPVIEVPFGAVLDALMAAVPVGLAGVGKEQRGNGAEAEEQHEVFHGPSVMELGHRCQQRKNHRKFPDFFLTSPAPDVTLLLAIAGKHVGL
jgi:hypothetical protein